MALSGQEQGTTVVTAMICAGAVSAQFIAGKATRDALFLANVDVTALPTMVILTAVFSIGLVFLTSRALRRMSPAAFVPVMFAGMAVLLLADWLLAPLAPQLAAQAVYLQISGIGPLLGSGFWLIATERFDPRSARKHFGRLAAVGTMSGLVGALVADRIAVYFDVTATLPFLAAINLLCAWQIRQLGRSGEEYASEQSLQVSAELDVGSPRSALHLLAETPYLRNLAVLVLLGTVGAALADYLFKAQAVGTLGRGEALLRFFAIYYAATSLVAFIVQTTASGVALEKMGLAATTSTPAMALLAGGIGAFPFANLYGITIARGGESVFRGSLFRTGYEIFYTPVPSHEKRAAKSIIDVGFDRLGDAIGGGLIRLMLLLPAARQYQAILATAIVCAVASLVLARRLNQGYIQTLERSLLHRAIELDLSDVQDLTTRTTMLRTLRGTRGLSVAIEPVAPDKEPTNTAVLADPELQEIIALRSRNRERVLEVLRTEEHLPSTLIPHVVPLLAWDPVAEDAVRALRKVAEERVGELIDALLDPNQPFAVRRRLARVFSICVSQRAVDGLLLALDDMRFEVRFQCGRSLAAILDRNNLVRINRELVFEVVRREVAVGKPIWEGHRLLDRVDDEQRSFVDEFLKDRAGQSLAHVFTLLSLVLPTEPLKISYRGLHTDDPRLRGTAVEYLEGVLPPDIRDRLRPFLAEGTGLAGPARPRDEIVADLLRSNQSIMLNLDELRRRADRASAQAGDRSKVRSKA